MAATLRATRMTPQASRATALLLALLLLVAVIAAIAVPAWLLHQRYDDEINRLERSYRAYQRAFQTRAATLEKLDAVTTKDASRFYLKAANLSLATAELQDKVSAVFSANGGRILTTQVPPAKDEGRFKQVIVNFQGYANAPTLRKMLSSLESAEPKVFVENFTVRSQLPFNYRGQPGVEPEMYITFDAIAYLPQAERAPAKADGKGGDSKSGKADAKSDTKADAKPESKGADAKADAKAVDAKVGPQPTSPRAGDIKPADAKPAPKDAKPEPSKPEAKK
jgi:general secretion pathway protein M